MSLASPISVVSSLTVLLLHFFRFSDCIFIERPTFLDFVSVSISVFFFRQFFFFGVLITVIPWAAPTTVIGGLFFQIFVLGDLNELKALLGTGMSHGGCVGDCGDKGDGGELEHLVI